MTVEKYQNTKILFTVIALALSSVLTACANGKEFETVPQPGANKTGVFPRFSQIPKGETTQFTQEERNQLANQLLQKRNKIMQSGSEALPTLQDIERQKQNATKTAEETLRKIEKADQ